MPDDTEKPDASPLIQSTGSLQLYYWAKENAFEDESEMTIHNPRYCNVIEHEEACEELNELLVALHDAINRPKGVVPKSAEKFYQANVKAQGMADRQATLTTKETQNER